MGSKDWKKSEKCVLHVPRKRSGSPLSQVKLPNFFRAKVFFIDHPSFPHCGIAQKKCFQESGWVSMDPPYIYADKTRSLF